MSDSNDSYRIDDTAIVTDITGVCTFASDWLRQHGQDITKYDPNVWLKEGDEVKLLYINDNACYVSKDDKTALIWNNGLKLKDDTEIKKINIKLVTVTAKTITDNLTITLSPLVKDRQPAERKIRELQESIKYSNSDIISYTADIERKKNHIVGYQKDMVAANAELKKIDLIDITGTVKKSSNSLSALPLKYGYVTKFGNCSLYLFLTDNLKISPIQMSDDDFDTFSDDEFGNIIYNNDGGEETPHDYFSRFVGKSLGHYAIVIKKSSSGWDIKAYNLDQRAMEGYDSCCINNGAFCWGNLQDLVYKQFNTNNLAGLLELAIDQITSPTHSASPYIYWDKFFKKLGPSTYKKTISAIMAYFGDGVYPLLRAINDKTLMRLIDTQLKSEDNQYSYRQLNNVITNIKNSNDPTRIL